RAALGAAGLPPSRDDPFRHLPRGMERARAKAGLTAKPCRAAAAHASMIEGDAELAGEVLDELPRHAPRPRSPGSRPFQRLCPELVGLDVQLEVGGITIDHFEIFGLRAIMEPEPQAEPVRQRYLLLH